MDLQKCISFLKTLPLWKGEEFGVQQFDFPSIDISTLKPEAIPSKLRLGHQMEHAFKQLVNHDNAYDIILYNLPIRFEKQTLGEIDFILKDIKNQRLIHIELTYKFYLISPEIVDPIHRLIGPNKNDMFFTKIEKIKNQQFKLLHTPEGIEALKRRNIDSTEITHQTCFKAQLFKQYKTTYNNIRPLNKDCIVGSWIPFNDFKTSEFKNCQYYIPFKSEWAMQPHSHVNWISHSQAQTDINLHMLKEKSPMVWVKKPDNTFEKLFVVWW